MQSIPYKRTPRARLPRYLTVLVAAGLAAASVIPTSDAGEREGGYWTGRGGTGTYRQKVEREPGHYKRSTTWQGKRGSGSKDVERRWDRGTGTAETKHSMTRADGKSAEWRRSGARNPDGSVTQQGSGTDFQGRDVTMDRRIEKTGDRSWKALSTHSREDGKSVTTEQTIQRTEEGITRDGTYITGEGRSGTLQSSTSRTDTGWKKQQTYTGQDGKTFDRAVSYDRTEDGVTRNVTVTGPDGETRERVGGANVTPR